MAKYKPKKPDSKIKVKKLQDTEGLNTGFGEYKEAVGGGHPFEAGNSNTRTTRENGKLREAENAKTKQPRTNDGKFTYKSVNGQSIDPKYGPSRGVTVPPTLTGGENGIKISEVEKGFQSQSGDYWDKYKDKWFRKGGMVVTTGLSTKISAEDVWKMAKEYDETLGEYKGEGENWETKKGAKSKEEKSAKEEVEKTGEQQNVIEAETGAIKIKPGTVVKQVINNATATPAPTPAPSAPQPSAPAQQPAQPAPAQPKPAPVQPALKHSKSELDNLRKSLLTAGVEQAKIDALSDQQLDSLWDKLTV